MNPLWIILAALVALGIGVRFGTLVTRHHAETELAQTTEGIRHEHRRELASAKTINDASNAKLIEWDAYANDVAKRDAEMETRLAGAQAALAREVARSDQMLAQMGEAVISQRKRTDAIPEAFREPVEALAARQPYAVPLVHVPDREPVWEALKSAAWPTLPEAKSAPQGDGPLIALAATLWKELSPAAALVSRMPVLSRGPSADLVIVDDNGPDIPASILDAQLAFYREQRSTAVEAAHRPDWSLRPAAVEFAPVDEMFVDVVPDDPKPNWRDVVTGYVLTDDMKVVDIGGVAVEVDERPGWSLHDIFAPAESPMVLPLDATRLDLMAPIRERPKAEPPKKTYPAKKNAMKRRKRR